MPDHTLKRRARARTLEFLFSLEFTDYDWKEALEAFWKTFETKSGAKQYAERLVSGVADHRDELDTAIAGALANWSWERVGHVERNILRIALFEMIYEDEVPAKVAINEAIELTKSYASADSPRFINGVLDRLREQIEDTSTASS